MSNKIDITQEQIKSWKEQYGNCIYKIPLSTGEVVYVRAPKDKEIEAVQPLLQNGKVLSYNKSLFKTCFLGGDDIMNDAPKLRGASAKMMETIEVITAEVEKL